jgi:hypothetical protein
MQKTAQSAGVQAGRQLRHRNDDIGRLRKSTIRVPNAGIDPPRKYRGVHALRGNSWCAYEQDIQRFPQKLKVAYQALEAKLAAY